jgi:hypothetical protein
MFTADVTLNLCTTFNRHPLLHQRYEKWALPLLLHQLWDNKLMPAEKCRFVIKSPAGFPPIAMNGRHLAVYVSATVDILQNICHSLKKPLSRSRCFNGLSRTLTRVSTLVTACHHLSGHENHTSVWSAESCCQLDMMDCTHGMPYKVRVLSKATTRTTSSTAAHAYSSHRFPTHSRAQ